ncbi:DUF7305 domain-containing protein [Franzmannia qiaohouensis]|uniref:PilX N-terminal domain-containing pilus assembly protein n=1 Tax=Franzmannia qiaohouensis TaxID=1329370 RepID=A0ABU1HK12_9GAMM|nr:PilX N-terminal domain-containing pilus assembly protein [Halomonas qiaohouensis]MDR5907821.1 PilX N-terminal domain-containing pilus assembly protein [Halomonas qiaohouensis]
MVIVLVLMLSTAVLSLSAMQSSLLNERLAGNFRESVQAYNEAEAGITDFYQALVASSDGDDAELSRFIASEAAPPGHRIREAARANNGLGQGGAALAGLIRPGPHGSASKRENASYQLAFPAQQSVDAAGQFVVVSTGRFGSGDHQAEREVIAIFEWTSERRRPFGGLMSCEGVSVTGSGIIDSYDAGAGPYGTPADNARRSGVVVGTQTDGAQVQVTGASPIYGDVRSTGTIEATGSGSIHGNVLANADVNLRGGGVHVYGDVESGGDVAVSSSGTVHGDIRANGRAKLGNWSSRVNGSIVAEHVDSVRDPDDQVGGTITRREGGAGVSRLPSVASSAECDSLNVQEIYDGYRNQGVGSGALQLGGQGRTVILDDRGLSDPVNPEAEVFVSESSDGLSLARLDSLTLGGSANLQIGSPERPVDMVLVVDGPISLGGGGSFRIAGGSTLRIVTSGQFDLGSGISVGDRSPSKIDENGDLVAVLSVVSTYDDQGRGGQHQGVRIRGASDFYGQVIAPFSHVDIAGSGNLYGALNGRTISVSGSGGFHYDESFGELALEPVQEAGGGRPRLVNIY